MATNVERPPLGAASLPANMGDKRNNGFMPLSGGPSMAHPSNEAHAFGDRRSGSFPLPREASAAHPPNHRFDLGDAKMGQPLSAFEPGKGTVPVYPFVPGGQGINRVHPEADSAKPFSTESWPPK
jgi:hypothetical protein